MPPVCEIFGFSLNGSRSDPAPYSCLCDGEEPNVLAGSLAIISQVGQCGDPVPTTTTTTTPPPPTYFYYTAEYCSGGSAGVVRFIVDQVTNSVFENETGTVDDCV